MQAGGPSATGRAQVNALLRKGPQADGVGTTEPHAQQVQASRPSAAGAAGVNKQSTINFVPEIQPLFKHRVLTEDLGRELRRHFAGAKIA